MIDLIASTTTHAGLKVYARLEPRYLFHQDPETQTTKCALSTSRQTSSTMDCTIVHQVVETIPSCEKCSSEVYRGALGSHLRTHPGPQEPRKAAMMICSQGTKGSL